MMNDRHRPSNLLQIEIGMLQVFSDYFLDVSTEVERNAARRTFELRVRGLFVCDGIIKYPRDWWQSLKARWFPKWLLRKYPVICIEYYIGDKKQALSLGRKVR